MTRMRTTERKRERQRQQRRRRLITIVVTVVAVVVLLLLFFLLANQPADAPIPPDALTRYDGLEQRRTVEGYPRLGEADAPIQVAVYCVYDSEECAAFNDAALQPLVDRVRAGSIAVSFVPLYTNQGNSEGAAKAALCAAEQQDFWPLHEALYAWLRQYGAVQAFAGNRLAAGAQALSMNMGQFNACVSGDNVETILLEALQDTRALVNFTTMPAVTINNVVAIDSEGAQLTDATAIIEAIDAAIARRASPEATAEPGAETTPDAVEAEATETATTVPAATDVPEATPEATQAA